VSACCIALACSSDLGYTWKEVKRNREISIAQSSPSIFRFTRCRRNKQEGGEIRYEKAREQEDTKQRLGIIRAIQLQRK
jgi:hypothetical protein